MSLNRCVFKWRLKVRMLSHSRMSAGREFQVDGTATEKARRASSVCMRGTTSIGRAQSPRWCMGLYQLIRDHVALAICMVYAATWQAETL